MEFDYNAGDIIEYKNRRYLITKVTTVYYTIRLDDGQTKHFQIYEQEDFIRTCMSCNALLGTFRIYIR